jgi:hypothetical protein
MPKMQQLGLPSARPSAHVQRPTAPTAHRVRVVFADRKPCVGDLVLVERPDVHRLVEGVHGERESTADTSHVQILLRRQMRDVVFQPVEQRSEARVGGRRPLAVERANALRAASPSYGPTVSESQAPQGRHTRPPYQQRDEALSLTTPDTSVRGRSRGLSAFTCARDQQRHTAGHRGNSQHGWKRHRLLPIRRCM